MVAAKGNDRVWLKRRCADKARASDAREWQPLNPKEKSAARKTERVHPDHPDRMAKRSKRKKGVGNGVSTRVAHAPSLPSWYSHDWLWGLILILAVILAYQPVWYAGYIWDDDTYITANPDMIGLLGFGS